MKGTMHGCSFCGPIAPRAGGIMEKHDLAHLVLHKHQKRAQKYDAVYRNVYIGIYTYIYRMVQKIAATI